MQIYLARNNEQAGPYSLEQVNQMLANGQVVLADLAWHEGMTQWQPLGELTGGELSYQPQGTSPFKTAPNLSKQPFGNDKTLNSSQNHNQNHSHSQNANPARARGQTGVALASINKRILAKLIDILLLWIPSSFIFGQFVSPEFMRQYQTIAGQAVIPSTQQQEQMLALLGTLPASAFWALAIYVVLYFVAQAFLLAKTGQSVGKKVLKIKIVDEQTSQKTTLTRSFLIRSVVFIIINYLAFFFIIIDFAFIFSERHRTLHDRLAKTLVVDANPSA
ncbi:MAG: RDD family protein [Moraxellaceae bacterium]|nr:MAG: RDD family protein [Moraxellaceae bacterium]